MSEETARPVPYVHLLAGRDALDVMRATEARFQELFARFNAAEIDQAPAPGKWSLREQMCHLADCEVAWAWRLRQTYGEDNPTLQPFEQDAWARAYTGPAFTFAQAFATWRALRAWNLAFLSALTAQDRQRPATHASAGPLTLWTLAEVAAGHDLHHIASLKRLADARTA